MSDLSEFIKKYGKPYDSDTDNYDVPPFQENIDNASKSSALYNMHMYWTKQDPYVVKRYIENGLGVVSTLFTGVIHKKVGPITRSWSYCVIR